MFIKLMFYVKYEFRYNYKLQYINMKMDMKKKAWGKSKYLIYIINTCLNKKYV